MIETKITFTDELVKLMADMFVNGKAGRKCRRVGTIILACMGAFFLFVGFYDITKDFGPVNIYYIILGCLMLLVGFVGLKLVQNWRFKKTVNSLMDQLNTRTRTYTFDENEIHSDFGYGQSVNNWSQIKGYVYASHYLIMKKTDNQYIVIDKNMMPADDVAQIEAWLKEKLVPGLEF